MRLIGVTGGIATGKSTVARMLAVRGASLVDADLLAREVVEPGRPALAEIEAAFGPGVMLRGGALDRTAMAARVFGDEAARRRLEAIVHPRVSALMQERIGLALNTGAPLVAVDVPLLFEVGMQDLFEGVLLVYAPPEVQIARLIERDGMCEDEARSRVAAQMPIEDKRALATWVIDNSGTPAQTGEQVQAWWRANVRAS